MWSRKFRNRVVQCLPQLGTNAKVTPLPSSDIRSLAIWKAKITTGACNQLECRARRDLIAGVSQTGPDATEILWDQMKIIALDQAAGSSPQSARTHTHTHTNLLSWGQKTLAEVISLDQLPNSSKACICTIPEKRVSIIKEDARAFFWKKKKKIKKKKKKVHSSTWLPAPLAAAYMHSLSLHLLKCYWKAFRPEELPAKRRKTVEFSPTKPYNISSKIKKISYIPTRIN